MNIVFNLLGVTGSPKINIQYPAKVFMANLNCTLNLLEASKINKVKKIFVYEYLWGLCSCKYTSRKYYLENISIRQDKYAGWAKRMGELQVEAYEKQYKKMDLYIVRPANIYGPYANFNPVNSMVVSSLIKGFVIEKIL